MKKGTPDHPKTLHFVAALEISVPAAVGHLEMLWHFTRDYAIRGDIGKYSDERIALACRWDGAPSRFILGLVDAGWLDRSKTYRLLVHDWPDHADDGVHCALARRVACFAVGPAPRLSRLNSDERKRLEPQWREHLASDPCACHVQVRRRAQRSRTLPSPAKPSPPLPTDSCGPDGPDQQAQPEKFFNPEDRRSVADGYIGVFNAAFGRRCTVTEGVETRVAARLSAWRAWQVVAQPLMVYANTTDGKFRDDIMPEWPLRDGRRPRTDRDGRTNGATDWLEREYNRADRTVLDGRLAGIARAAGLLDKLQQIGVRVADGD